MREKEKTTNNVRLMKAQFVGRELNELLCAIDDGVEGCFYEYRCDKDGELLCETVIVNMKDGSSLKVNITMDSLTAIVRDVMKFID